MRDSILLLRIVVLASLALAAATVTAQTTVTVGPSYANQTYYDLQNGTVRTEPLASWDIAFQVNGFSSAISTNGGAGVSLYSVPGKTVDNWAGTLDTTGMSTWKVWQNSSETWDVGAFNLDSDYQTGNVGWGEYDVTTHVIAGTTLYVIVLPDKSVRKIVIDELTSGVYNFRYANLDGSGEVSANLTKSDYPGRNFGYYSIRDGKALDHEPPITDWDFVFGKYNTPVSGTPYVVTGVRSNRGVHVARVVTPAPATVAAPGDEAYSSSITGIGYDWKSFNGTAYEVDDSLAYFVKDTTGGIWRIVFTGFGGGTTGNFVFNQQAVSAASVKDADGYSTTTALYPSIAGPGSNVEIVYMLERGVGNARAIVSDAAGRTVTAIDLDGTQGLHRAALTAPDAAGIYFVSVRSGAGNVSRRLIVR